MAVEVRRRDVETGALLMPWTRFPSRIAATRALKVPSHTIGLLVSGAKPQHSGFEARQCDDNREGVVADAAAKAWQDPDDDGDSEEGVDPNGAVEQLDAETGEVLARWPSPTAAQTALSIHDIGTVLRHEAITAGGFRWRHATSGVGGRALSSSAARSSASVPQPGGEVECAATTRLRHDAFDATAAAGPSSSSPRAAAAADGERDLTPSWRLLVVAVETPTRDVTRHRYDRRRPRADAPRGASAAAGQRAAGPRRRAVLRPPPRR